MTRYKSKQETYVDLEIQASQQKVLISIVEDIKQLIKQYPNDKELGTALLESGTFLKTNSGAALAILRML